MSRTDVLEAIIEAIPDPVYVKDLDGRYILANPAAAIAVGASSPNEVIGKHPWDILPRDSAQEVIQDDRHIFDTGRAHTFENTLLMPSGEKRMFLTSKSPHRDTKGKLIGLIGLSRDITEQKHMERNLAENEQLFRTIFQLSPIGLGHADPQTGKVLQINDRHCQITGYSRAELLSSTVRNLTHPDDRAADWEKFQQMVSGKTEEYDNEKRYIRKNGEVIWVHVTARALRDDQGKATRTIGMLQDITERKQAEEDLRKARDEAERAVHLRDDFLSIASHELKTPLTSLGMQIQIINRLVEQGTLAKLPKEKTANLLRISQQQLSRFSTLVNDLLDASRISAGKLTLHLEEVDLSKMIQDVVRCFQREVEERNCSVEKRIDAALVGRWDRLRVEQVITNLLSNAMKYGAGKPIIITAQASGDGIKVSVQDHGPGIAKEDQSRVFQKFERAASPKSFGGLGLGLYITRQIIEAHRGSIQIESEPGHGSIFTVTLPH